MLFFVYFVLFVSLDKLTINFKGKLAETSTHNGVDRSAANKCGVDKLLCVWAQGLQYYMYL